MPEQGRVAEPAITPNPPVNPSTGKRCGVHTRCSRSPQKYREWLAWYPYCAHPASSERRAVSRDRPHSTGVESTTLSAAKRAYVSLGVKHLGFPLLPWTHRLKGRT